ncbi:hypothetical protein, partial [Paenibacillus residui]
IPLTPCHTWHQARISGAKVELHTCRSSAEMEILSLRQHSYTTALAWQSFESSLLYYLENPSILPSAGIVASGAARLTVFCTGRFKRMGENDQTNWINYS